MRTALIISTYNQPDVLGLVLRSVVQQSRLPDEVLIADDGSTPATRNVIDQFSDCVSNRVLHCWQPDQGFRKTRILNRAIVAATAEYLVFSDGDMLLHPQFISDHVEIALPGRYTQGRRICFDERATTRILNSDTLPRPHLLSRGLNRRSQMIRNRWLMKRFSTENQGLKNSRGCNQAFWRQDLLDVNGYDEQMQGWGREDTELCVRLHNLGRHRFYARHWALAWHLFHPELSRDQEAANRRQMESTIAVGKVRATQGIDQIPASEAAA
ncbi:MAG: glycosyltransferase family 2 protein [Pirellulaceae bacterium]